MFRSVSLPSKKEQGSFSIERDHQFVVSLSQKSSPAPWVCLLVSSVCHLSQCVYHSCQRVAVCMLHLLILILLHPPPLPSRWDAARACGLPSSWRNAWRVGRPSTPWRNWRSTGWSITRPASGALSATVSSRKETKPASYNLQLSN